MTIELPGVSLQAVELKETAVIVRETPRSAASGFHTSKDKPRLPSSCLKHLADASLHNRMIVNTREDIYTQVLVHVIAYIIGCYI